MNRHFENRAAAEADLIAHAFKPLKNGNWANDVCAANITPRFGDWVLVGYWEAQSLAIALEG